MRPPASQIESHSVATNAERREERANKRDVEPVVCISDAKSLLGEGPFWDIAEQRLYWVDIKRRLIHRFDPATGNDETWLTPEVVGSLAVREQGGLVLALKSGFYFYDLDYRYGDPSSDTRRPPCP